MTPWIAGLDHLVVLTRDLDAAVASYRALLGCEPSWRSVETGSRHALFTLANASLELIAPEEGDTAGPVRTALNAQGEGLASICFRAGDIEKLHRRLGRVGLKPAEMSGGGSVDTMTGAKLAWRRTRAATDAAHGVRLFFLEMQGERPLSRVSAEGALTAVDHIVINTQNPERAAALYGARLGLDMALDRSNPDWGRLMFFRCGDLIVEVVQRPGKNDPGASDRLWGMCLRTSDIGATHLRLKVAGIDVSDLRSGRKPGTQVMTVRSGSCGVPTLILQSAVLF